MSYDTSVGCPTIIILLDARVRLSTCINLPTLTPSTHCLFIIILQYFRSDLIYLAGQGGQNGVPGFVDCTFVVPQGFYQALIIMIYDYMSEEYDYKKKVKIP